MTPVGGSVLTLPAGLDRLAVEPLCRTLQERLAAGDALLIDARQVDRISTASVQVLLAAARSAAVRDIPFHVSAASGVLIEALDDLGLAGSLPGVEGNGG